MDVNDLKGLSIVRTLAGGIESIQACPTLRNLAARLRTRLRCRVSCHLVLPNETKQHQLVEQLLAES